MMELVKVENGDVIVAQEVINKIIEFNKLKKEMEYQEELLKEGLMEAMNKVGLEKFIINGLSATIKKPYEKKSLDTKRLKEECPEIYDSYSKTSIVASSIILEVA